MKNEQIEILVEERSMYNFLRVILLKILPEGYELNVNCFIRPHEGKNDLRKSIPGKARAYQHYHLPVKLIIIHDQNSAECVLIKDQQVGLITTNCMLPHLVRIACRELECWYLGDLNAVENVYPKSKASKFANKSKFRDPDLLNGTDEMTRLCNDFTKGFASREIPKYIDIENNSSNSFNHLISGIKNFLS